MKEYLLKNYLIVFLEIKEILKFENVSDDWGISSPSFSNGAAYADLDNDGDLDMVINNIDDEASIYRNTTIENGFGNYLKVGFKDSNNKYAKVSVLCRCNGSKEGE